MFQHQSLSSAFRLTCLTKAQRLKLSQVLDIMDHREFENERDGKVVLKWSRAEPSGYERF